MRRRGLLSLTVLAAGLAGTPGCVLIPPVSDPLRPPAPPREAWTAEVIATQTLEGVGAAQGVTVHGGLVYVYGDADTGVIREYSFDDAGPTPALRWTGREVRLSVGGVDQVPHPTGLAIDAARGTPATAWLGDTVNQIGVIRLIDWDRVWASGTLDGAVLHAAVADAASNGCRPEWVRYEGHWALATSDYGDESNEIRLLDADRLRVCPRTSSPGVVIARVPCGPFVQTLEWLDETGELVLVQNTTPGLGHRLTLATLGGGSLAGEARLDLPVLTDELEGFAWVKGDQHASGWGVLISSSARNNARVVRLSRP